MGVDKSIYIGPYVQVKNEVIDVEITANGCRKCKTGEEHSAPSSKFCDKCGTALGPYQKKVKRDKVNTWKLTEKMGEKLHVERPQDDIDIFLPNRAIKGVTRETGFSGRSDSDEGVTPISSGEVELEIKAFEETFSKELKMVKDAYGKMTIVWGIVVTYS